MYHLVSHGIPDLLTDLKHNKLYTHYTLYKLCTHYTLYKLCTDYTLYKLYTHYTLYKLCTDYKENYTHKFFIVICTLRHMLIDRLYTFHTQLYTYYTSYILYISIIFSCPLLVVVYCYMISSLRCRLDHS